MNRKGTFIHWIIFLVLAALGLFLVYIVDFGSGLDVKGEWQVGFLEKGFLAAEKDLLKIDQTAKFTGWQTALELGEKGGFIAENECGAEGGYNFWNKKEEWCVPEAEGSAALLVDKKLGENYSGIKFIGEEMLAKGKEKTIEVKDDYYLSYTYGTSFRVDLNYNFGEYEQIRTTAQDLVIGCRNESDLFACVNKTKKENWKFKDCGEEYISVGREVLFCVESVYSVYNGQGQLVPVRYKLGLDFSGEEELIA